MEERRFQRRHLSIEIAQRKLEQRGGRLSIPLCNLSIEDKGPSIDHGEDAASNLQIFPLWLFFSLLTRTLPSTQPACVCLCQLRCPLPNLCVTVCVAVVMSTKLSSKKHMPSWASLIFKVRSSFAKTFMDR